MNDKVIHRNTGSYSFSEEAWLTGLYIWRLIWQYYP